MNIFFLSTNPRVCAQWHCDKHCVKMILEYAQLLCTSHRWIDGDEDFEFCNGDDREKLYKCTHQNHPCSVWVRETSSNYEWLYSLFHHLCIEYTIRYNRRHKTDLLLSDTLKHTPSHIPTGPMTHPAQAMPDEYKVEQNATQAYRIYYYYGKKDIALWSKCNTPWWFS